MIRHLPTAVGWVLAALAALGLLAHFVPFELNVLVALGAGSSYLVALAPVALVLLAVRRRWWPACAAAALTVAAVAVLLPTRVGAGAEPHGPALSVLTANLRLGSADAAALVRDARTTGADVVLLQELTPAERRGLAAAGLDALLPHSAVDARPGAAGVGLWSRYPLADEQHHGGFVFAAVSARVLLGSGRPTPTVLTVHMPGPWPQPAGDWVRDMASLPGLMAAVARRAGPPGTPVVVGGDLNATYGNAQFRGLLTGGFRDAAEQAGAGWTATYPASYPGIPPLLGIDHVLLRSAGVREVSTVTVPGSDHRGLVSRVELGGP